MADLLGPPSLADTYASGPVGRQSLNEQTMTAPGPDVMPAGRDFLGRPADPLVAAMQKQVMRDATRDALGFAGATNIRIAKPIRGYHGSPHNFPAERLVQMPDGSTQWITGKPDVLPDIPNGAKVIQDFPLGRFRMDKIGTGEGNQAYGYGAYIAEREGVARDYRNRLSNKAVHLDASKYDGNSRDVERIARNWLEYQDVNPSEIHLFRVKQPKDFADKIVNDVIDGKIKWNSGHMYEVNLHVDPKRLLDWDKPLNRQSDAVRSGLVKDKWIGSASDDMAGDFIRDLAPQDQLALRESGIPGIRYLDGGSRGAGQGSHNYVIFDPLVIEILRKYGLLPPVVGGAALAGVGSAQAQQ